MENKREKMKLTLKAILVIFLTFFTSEIKSFDFSKEIEGKNEHQSKNDDTKVYRFNKSEIFNQLFTIYYYDNRDMHNVRKNLTLVNNIIDTSYSFDSRIRDIHRSNNLIADYLRNIGKLRNDRNKTGISNGHFYLREVIPVDSSNFIGVFVEYFGWERICYVYGKIKLVDDNYYLGRLYRRLDATGIGAISYERAFNLGDDNYYIICHNSGEASEGIALLYFSNQFINKSYNLDSCTPADGEETHDEKIEYTYDFDKENIVIKKYEWEGELGASFSEKEPEWKLVSTKDLYLRFIIKKMKKMKKRYFGH